MNPKRISLISIRPERCYEEKNSVRRKEPCWKERTPLKKIIPLEENNSGKKKKRNRPEPSTHPDGPGLYHRSMVVDANVILKKHVMSKRCELIVVP